MSNDATTRPDATGKNRDNENPIYWEPSLAYLKLTCGLLFIGAMCFMLMIRVVAPDQTGRYLASAIAGVVALSAWLLAAQGQIKTAVYMLAIGAWIVITGIAFFFGGVRAPVIYAYPISIVLFGWLISSRLAIWLAGLSATIIIGFVYGESSGFLPTQPPTPAALHGVVQVLVMALSAALIHYLLRASSVRLNQGVSA